MTTSAVNPILSTPEQDAVSSFKKTQAGVDAVNGIVNVINKGYNKFTVQKFKKQLKTWKELSANVAQISKTLSTVNIKASVAETSKLSSLVAKNIAGSTETYERLANISKSVSAITPEKISSNVNANVKQVKTELSRQIVTTSKQSEGRYSKMFNPLKEAYGEIINSTRNLSKSIKTTAEKTTKVIKTTIAGLGSKLLKALTIFSGGLWLLKFFLSPAGVLLLGLLYEKITRMWNSLKDTAFFKGLMSIYDFISKHVMPVLSKIVGISWDALTAAIAESQKLLEDKVWPTLFTIKDSWLNEYSPKLREWGSTWLNFKLDVEQKLKSFRDNLIRLLLPKNFEEKVLKFVNDRDKSIEDIYTKTFKELTTAQKAERLIKQFGFPISPILFEAERRKFEIAKSKAEISDQKLISIAKSASAEMFKNARPGMLQGDVDALAKQFTKLLISDPSYTKFSTPEFREQFTAGYRQYLVPEIEKLMSESIAARKSELRAAPTMPSTDRAETLIMKSAGEQEAALSLTGQAITNMATSNARTNEVILSNLDYIQQLLLNMQKTAGAQSTNNTIIAPSFFNQPTSFRQFSDNPGDATVFGPRAEVYP